MAWKALIADVGFRLGKDLVKPGSILDQKLMSPEEIDAHIAAGRAHFELRGRPDKGEADEAAKPKKGKKD